MVEIITSGKDIAASLTAMSADAATGNAIFTGAISCLLGVFHKLKAVGLVPGFADPEVAKFSDMGPSQMAATLTQSVLARDALLGPRLSVLAFVATTHRDKISFAQAAAPAPAPPIDVRVVGLPDRVTTTSVEHDAKGNIKTATQTERDAPIEFAGEMQARCYITN